MRDDREQIEDLLRRHIESYNSKSLQQYLDTFHPECISLPQIESASKAVFESHNLDVSIQSIESTTSDGALTYARIVQRTVDRNNNQGFRDNDVEQVLVLSDFEGQKRIVASAPISVHFL